MFSSTQFSVAQNKELKIETKETVKSDINPLSPAKAAFYSAILPGLGQAYNKRYWKIPLVYAALGAGTYFIIDNNKKFNLYRDEYKKRLANGGVADTSDPNFGKLSNESIIRGQKFFQKNRDLSVLITAGLYILNIVDANVDAHLLQFNVNDDLSLKPDLQTNPYTFKQNVGFTLTYQF
ncbi:MAG: DUF5683 domain-containing protein [Bacteroidota bacterium]